MQIRKKLLSLVSLIVLVSCGGGGGGGDSTPTPPPSPPASVNLSADPLSVLLGDETTLTWSTANASSCSASGTWSGSRSTSGSEGVAIQTVGDNQFTLTCSGPGGSGSDSVSVEGYENITGVSVDGYLTSASVFYDLNENFILDSNEESSTSNDSGGFALRKNDSLLVSLGGIDSDTQKNFEDLLLVNRSDASLDFKSITPITSVASFMSSPVDIYSILNIQDSIDIYSYDPVVNKNNDFASSLVFEKGNQLTILAYSIQSIVNAQLATEDTTQDYFSYIAQELENQFLQTNEAVNIEDESFILQVIEKSLQEKSVELTEPIKNNMAKALSSVITLIQVREIQAADIGLFNFATSTLINDLISIADGSAGSDLIENYDTESVSEYVATTEGLPQEDLTPEIKATNDFVSIDEDTSITLNVLANDSLVAGVAVDIVVEGSDDGFVSNNNGNVTFVPSQDFNGTATFGYSISQSIYGGLTSDALIFIEVRPVNDAPQITTPSSLDVNENETFVVTLQADDVEGDEIAFTKNGDDADEFNLGTDSGDLEFIEAPDFEERSTYNVITIASDGSDSSEKNIAINIIDLDDTAPVINPPLEFIAEENQLSIGQITATDVDTEDVEIVYSVSGSEIVISSDTGVLTFQEAPDFETKNEYNASVTATDGANSSTEEILVQIENINDNSPIFTSSEIFAVDENQLIIGTVDAEDADGDNLSFSVNSSEISINSESGELTFLEEPDYETKTSYVAAVSVSDSVFSATQDIEINLINLNDNSPVFNSDTTFTVNENETAIGTASATDADGDTLTYSISGSEISIDSATGVMSFVAAPDYETKPSYSATVTASDGANSEQQEISININNLNDNEPIFESSLTFTANENQTAIGTASATDADGDTLTYSISGSEISIDSATGVMSFVAAPDYETKPSYSATVTASDGTFASSKQVSIEVINLNDNAPILTSANTFIVDENEIAIGTASATDADGDTLTYSISGSEISIDSATGVMSFVAAPDYETKTAYQVTLVIRDGAFTVTEELSITINDLNDNNPLFNTSTNFSVPEEESFIGTIQATDADANTQIVYSTDSDLISVGNASGELNFLIQTDYESVTQYIFNISASDGENITTEAITVNIDNINDNAPEIISSSTFNADENQTAIGKVEASDADGDSLAYSVTSSDITIDSDGVLTFITPPDYETQTAYNATVGVTDGLFSTSQQIVITIGNLEDNAPVYTGVNEFFVDENQTAIGTITATDADGSDLSFSISNPDISINNATGIMSFVSAPDYEQQTEYSETIQITDGTLTTNADINIFINNLNDNTPELTSGTTYSADENQTAIGTVTATDADGDSVTFSVSGSELEITSGGVLTFASAPDYETKSSYSAALTLSDGENNTTVNIIVAVNNLNDNAPVFTSDASFSVDENETVIGTVTATDLDSDSITFSISGSGINIDSSTGVLTFVEAPDYETKSTYTATVTASDGTNSTTQELNISINNINDNEPVITSGATFSADENQTIDVGFIVATDADGDSLSYAIDNNIGDGSEIVVNATTGEITFASAPDYEAKSSYSGTVSVSDGTNRTEQDILININNLDDVSPVFSSSNTFTADENQKAIGTVTATDVDSDSITFSISGSEINIDSSAGVLTFVEAPDYETKSTYTATVTASDGTNSTTQDITVTVNDLNDNTPELTSGTTYSADENQTAIGTVTATDADGDDITFSISGSEINIDSSTGVLTFVEAPDYETKSSYSAALTLSDGENNTTVNIIVAVNNLNDNAPVFTSDASFSLSENVTVIGTVTATDADGDDIQFRVLSSDDDNISITSNGQLSFINAPDYETKNSYTGVIEAYDSNNSTSQNITIDITNVTEESNPPVFSNFDFPDGKTVTFSDSDFEARVRVTDETGVDLSKLPIPRFIKVEGNTSVDADGAWTLNEGTIKDGIYQVRFNFPQGLPSGDYFLATFDFVDLEGNADNAYSNIVDNKVISVLGAEGNAPSFADFQISPTSVDVTQEDASVTVVVRAIDDSAIDQTLLPTPRLTTTSGVNFSANAAWENIEVDGNSEYRAIFTVPQAQPSGSYYVETLFFTDIFGNSAQGFSNTENIYLEIIGAEGNAPVLKDPAISPSSVNVIYEAQNVTLSITATDDTGIDIASLPVPRLILSDSTFINASQWSLSSGTDTNGTYTAIVTIPQGQPSGDYYMYTGAYFYDIYGNKADLFSNLNPYNITLLVENKSVPVFTSGATFTADENQTAIGTVTATDADGDTITYSISGSEINIDSSAGVLTFASAPDYETKSTYTATVTATDGTTPVTQDITVTVTNINESPIITSSDTFSVTEPLIDIGTITSSDPESDSISYSIAQGDASSMSINSASGVLTFNSASDYETKSSYTTIVTATDGNLSTTQSITITIQDASEETDGPSWSGASLDPSSVDVSSSAKTVTATVQITDASGVNQNNLPIPRLEPNQFSGSSISANTAYQLTSGSTTNGTYSATFTIPLKQAGGNYYLVSGRAYDIWGNSATNQEGSIDIDNGEEQDVPVLTNSSYSTNAVDVSKNAATVTTSIRVQDASGIDQTKLPTPYFSAYGFSGTISPNTSWQLTSGTATDGTYTAVFTIPVGTTFGNYIFQSGTFYDISGRGANNQNNNYLAVNLNPSFTSSSTYSAAENQSAIGTASASDPQGDTITFSISGTDASSININSSTGVLTFKSPPNYEVKSSYSATLTATSSKDFPYFNQSITQDITVNVTDVNDLPAFTSSANFSAAENQTEIGTVTATDADGDTIAYSISGSEITIDSSTGVLTFASAPDYETKSTYTATVTASDGTDSTTQDITVNVTDVSNEAAPVFTSSATFSAAENQTAIGTVTATDADGDTITYSISGSEITINSSTGVLTFVNAPDYETKSTYTATVTATDGTNSTTQDITVSVTDVNDNTPIFTSSDSFAADEGQTSVGTITATDADGDDLSFSISGNDAGSFVIGASTGVLEFVQAYDYENDPSQRVNSIVVTVTDGTNEASQNVTVTLNNINDNSPVFTSSANFSAAENQTAIGTVTATDADGDSVTFSVSGSELAITSGGVLTFASAPDYETKSTYTATVTASDGTNSTTQDITVNVTDVNENSPVFTSSATFSAAENQTAIGTVTATDADGDTITYSISGSEITINSSTGVLTFASAPDYETKSTYTATVTASDGTDSTTQDITVNVTDVNENSPVFTSSATFSAAENQTAIGTVTATDADDDTITYSISSSEININSSTGALIFVNAPDYETKSTYTATVTASDGTNSTTQDITVNVTDVNDNTPTFTSSATFSAAENQTAIGTVTATDADGDSVTFSVSGSELEITSGGVLTFASTPDYETKSSYSATVTVTDGLLSTTQDITVSIINVNDNSPVFTSSATFSAAENQTAIGTVTATDADGNAITYSISGSEIAINSSTGVLTFASAPDYETKSTYIAIVTATDGANSSIQSITVNVTDVDENTNTQPVAIAASHTVNLLPKDQTAKTLTLVGTDADGDSLTYAIVSSPSQGTVSLSGATVTYQTNSGVDSAQTDTFTFKVNDGTVDSDAATVTLDLRTDPLYQYQWHLDNTGQKNFATGASTASFDLNVDTVIAAGYTGDGVLVSVVDEGLELAHEDLVDNIVAGSWDYTNGDNDPTRSANDGDHGTSVAGIINSAGWNNKGGRGVAPEASLIGANFLDSNTSQSYEAQSWGVNSSGGVTADIYNLSYGTSYSDVYGMQWTAGDEVGGSALQDALVYGTTNHRNGKGAVYVKSTGNAFHQDTAANRACGEDSSFVDSGIILSCSTTSYDLKHSFPQTMPVAALGAGGVKSSYSTPGPAVWISGFGGEYGYSSDLYSSVAGTKFEGPAIMTADQTGCTNGYVGANGGQQPNIFNDGTGDYSENSNCNYTSTFNGTSSAAPSVSGVVALMMEANPDLTWRDVKHILASTAVKFDADRTTLLAGIPQYEWETNAAGYNFHNWYGFGKVDAAAAVSMAETYSVDLGTFDSKTAIIGEYSTVIEDLQLGYNYSIDFTAPAGSKNFVEFIRVIVNIDHAAPNTFGLRLTSPEGTQVNILQPYTNLGFNPADRYFPIGVNAFYGEEMTGTWTLEVLDYAGDGVKGVLKNWGIIVYGGKTS